MASATVKKGTRASSVVNVRLLAVRPRRSSRKRSRSVCAVVRQGKRDRSDSMASKRCARWAMDMADMMPSRCLHPPRPSPPHRLSPSHSPAGSPWAACWASSCFAWPGSYGWLHCAPAAPGWRSRPCRSPCRWRACSSAACTPTAGSAWWCGCTSPKGWYARGAMHRRDAGWGARRSCSAWACSRHAPCTCGSGSAMQASVRRGSFLPRLQADPGLPLPPCILFRFVAARRLP